MNQFPLFTFLLREITSKIIIFYWKKYLSNLQEILQIRWLLSVIDLKNEYYRRKNTVLMMFMTY